MVSSSYAAATLAASLILPYVGKATDRYGVRALAVVVSALFGLACVGMSFVSGIYSLFIGLLLLRSLGQGSLTLVSNNAVAQWFIRKRGRAMGLSGIGTAFSMGLFPLVADILISSFGWRTSYEILGAAVWLTILPLGAVFFRSRPEDHGLIPDGESLSEVDQRTRTRPVEENWTLSEANKTRAFWILMSVFAVVSCLATGLMFHQVSIFQLKGLDPVLAAVNYAPIAFIGVVVTLFSGAFIDRFPVPYLLSAMLCLVGIDMVIAQTMTSACEALIYGMVLGIVLGMQRAVSTTIWANYFGRLHLGSITGIAQTSQVAASAMGPLIFGLAFDYFGSHNQALTASLILPMALAAAVLSMKRPTRRR